MEKPSAFQVGWLQAVASGVQRPPVLQQSTAGVHWVVAGNAKRRPAFRCCSWKARAPSAIRRTFWRASAALLLRTYFTNAGIAMAAAMPP